MPATAWALFFMFPLTRTSRPETSKLLLKYIKINENGASVSLSSEPLHKLVYEL